MKAIVIEKAWDIQYKDMEIPALTPGYTRIRVRAAGICGSDLNTYRGTNALVSYPRIIGHELAGEVEEICGDNPNGLKIGDRVVVDPYVPCHKCYPCSIGRTNCCVDLKVAGVMIEGGMAEYFVHPTDMLVKVPADMPWELIPVAEPVTIALHGIHRLKLKAGEHIVISGAGTIGMLVAMCALQYGAEPILVDLVEERLAFARELGVKYTVNLKTDNLLDRVREITGGQMAECALEASGANSAIRAALDVVSHAGRVALTGWPVRETSIPTDMITRKEIDIYGSRTSVGEFAEAVDLIYSGRIDAQKILTRVIALDEVPEVLADIERNPGAYLKVNVKID